MRKPINNDDVINALLVVIVVCVGLLAIAYFTR